MSKRKRVAILISGHGSNMENLIRAAREPDFPAEISVVISSRPDARGERASNVALSTLKRFREQVRAKKARRTVPTETVTALADQSTQVAAIHMALRDAS